MINLAKCDNGILDFSIPEFKKIEPLLEECFGYSRFLIRAMLEPLLFYYMGNIERIQRENLDMSNYIYYKKEDGSWSIDKEKVGHWILSKSRNLGVNKKNKLDKKLRSKLSESKYWVLKGEDEDDPKIFFSYFSFIMDTKHSIRLETDILDISERNFDTEKQNEIGMIDIELAIIFISILYDDYMKGELDFEMGEVTHLYDSTTIFIKKKKIDESTGLQLKDKRGRPDFYKEEKDITEIVQNNNIHRVQQDKLRLYIFLQTSKQPITLRGKNKAVTLNCATGWLSDLLKKDFYSNLELDRFLSDEEILDEAKRLLAKSEENQKKIKKIAKGQGRGEDPFLNIFAYGIYKILQYTDLKSPKENPKEINQKQVKFICKCMKQINHPLSANMNEKDDEDEDMKSRITKLLSDLRKKDFQPDLYSWMLGARPVSFSK